MRGNFKVLTGLKFSNLLVKEHVGRDKFNNALWLCVCDCGNTKIVRGSNLTSGRTKSCGCLVSEIAKSGVNRKRHGCTGTRLHWLWKQMRSRCNNKNSVAYKKWYGSKGITVCDEWNNSFESFRDWALSNGYADDLTIDRIDNDGNYEPSNCRWVTCKEQARNTSQNVNLTFNGETHCLKEWAELLNVTYSTLRHRLERGWTTERLLTQPMRMCRKKG